MGITGYFFTPAVIAIIWAAGIHYAGESLVPPPLVVLYKIRFIMTDPASIGHLAITVYRGMAGFLTAYIIAVPAGIVCGLNTGLMNALSSFITVLQSFPPVVWISLLVVWSGTGGTVPVTLAFLSILPVVFFSVASGFHSIDRNLFSLARVYGVPAGRVFSGIIIPGMYRPIVSSVSYSLGVVFKVITVAEFLGSSDGIGSRLYRSFRHLDMADLFAWSFILMILGLMTEFFIIMPLRKRSNSTGGV